MIISLLGSGISENVKIMFKMCNRKQIIHTKKSWFKKSKAENKWTYLLLQDIMEAKEFFKQRGVDVDSD